MKITTQEFLTKLFQFQIQIKLYHWNTNSYSNHKATDKLFKKLLEFIDCFIESYMGKFKQIQTPIPITFEKKINERNIISKVFQPFLNFLKEWKEDFKKEDQEYIHLIEDLEIEVEKTKYLMRLK
jgi:DNA-binding ferritin-like protein